MMRKPSSQMERRREKLKRGNRRAKNSQSKVYVRERERERETDRRRVFIIPKGQFVLQHVMVVIVKTIKTPMNNDHRQQYDTKTLGT